MLEQLHISIIKFTLSKIRPQKTNSYDLDPDNNFAKYQIQRDRNQQNHL